MCVYIHAFIYVDVCMYVYVCMYISISLSLYIYIYIYIYTHIFVQVWIPQMTADKHARRAQATRHGVHPIWNNDSNA